MKDITLIGIICLTVGIVFISSPFWTRNEGIGIGFAFSPLLIFIGIWSLIYVKYFLDDKPLT